MSLKKVDTGEKLIHADREKGHSDQNFAGTAAKTVRMNGEKIRLDHKTIRINRKTVDITRKTNRATTDMDYAVIHMDRK